MIAESAIHQLCQIAIQAGEAIADLYRQNQHDLQITAKQDGSAVTKADLVSHQIIMQGLAKLAMPSYPVISEESELAETAKVSDYACCWLVDPLDGTRGFIDGYENFTVNIALVKNGYPVFGVIQHPLTGECIWALAGEGAFIYTPKNPRLPLPKQQHQPPAWRILTGRYQNKTLWAALLAGLGKLDFQAQNSSIKFCTLAKGDADIYPRGSQISAWDTAAGQCILEAAGGAVIDFNGRRLCYTGAAKSHKNRPGNGFVACADRKYVSIITELLTKGVITNDKTR